MTAIKYTQSAASQEVPPPYHFPGVIVHAFVWEASMQRVQAYCDKYFNLGTAEERGFVYRPVPIWPYAVLLILEYPEMVSSSPERVVIDGKLAPYSDRGIISQTEAFVAFPVVRYGTRRASRLLNTNLEFALPFITVENAMSAVCGREMLGMGKLLGLIETGEGVYPGSFSGSIDLPGWPMSGPGVMERNMRFLTVETGPGLPTFRGSPETSSRWTLFQSREAGWALDETASLADFVEDVTAGSSPTVMRTTSLKQIRDARCPEKAVYQALVSSRAHYDNVREFCFYNENDVCITFKDVGSFKEVLDEFLDPPSTAGADRQVKAKAAFKFIADIDFDETHTIHTFPNDGDPHLAPASASRALVSPWLRPLWGLFGPRPS